MRLEVATSATIGGRTEQQDSAGHASLGLGVDGCLIVLADGLGGHRGGREASNLAVQTFLSAAQGDGGATPAFIDPTSRFAALRSVMEDANRAIGERGGSRRGSHSMGTTLVAAVIAPRTMQWISVGDSHLYVVRNSIMTKLNEDHSQAGLMIKTGKYEKDDPDIERYRHMLRSALLGRPPEFIDHQDNPRPPRDGDIVILATDGLNTLADNEIEELVAKLRTRSAVEIADALIDAVEARQAEDQDNATVLVAKVIEAD